MKKYLSLISIILVSILILSGCGKDPQLYYDEGESQIANSQAESTTVTLKDIPAFSGSPYIAINDNQPSFTSDDYTTNAFEKYAELDYLGRCGVTYACVGVEIMPTEDRGSIGQVKPTGWVTAKYDFVDGKYLYNRCT